MNKLKYGILGFIIGAVFFGGIVLAASSLDVEILPLKYFFDGVQKTPPSDQNGFIYNGRTYLPLRFIAESLGKEVAWDERTLSIYVGKKEVTGGSTQINIQSNEHGNTSGNIANGGYVAQKDEWIYYRNSSDDDRLYKVKIDGSQKTKITDDRPRYINVVSDWLFYSNEADKNKLYRIKTDGTQRTKIDDDSVGNILVEGNTIYFSKSVGTDAFGGIYQMNVDGTSKIELADGIISCINVVDGWIYYSDFSGGRIYKMKVDGTKVTQLNDFRIGQCLVIDENIFCSNIYEDGALHKMSIKGSDDVNLNFPDNVNAFNIYNGWIYYSNKSDDGKLYKLSLDGLNKIKMSDISCSNICIVDNWVYFKDNSDKVFYLNRIKLDGTGQEQVN